MEELLFIIYLPSEIIYQILQYLSHNTLIELISVPFLNQYVTSYLHPVCLIDSKAKEVRHNPKVKVFKTITAFTKFQKLHNYSPQRLVLSNNIGTNKVGASTDWYSPYKLEIVNNLELINARNVVKVTLFSSFSLPIRAIPSHITELSIFGDKLNLVHSNIQTLAINQFDLRYMELLTESIKELKLLEFKLPSSFPSLSVKFPINLTHLTITEGQHSLSLINLQSLLFLKLLNYKGNLKLNTPQMTSMQDLQLPESIERVCLKCLNLVSLQSISNLKCLTHLEIIDFPKLFTFFDTKFPSGLKTLIYKFDTVVPNLSYFQNQMVLNFDSSRLVRETTTGNMIFLKIDERFEIPNQLKVLILENIPYVKVSKSINIPTTLNELIIRKIPGVVPANNFNIVPLNTALYRLTLSNMMLDSLEGMKFPEKLSFLDLSRNQLQHIHGTNLHSLKYLRELNLLRNRFERFIDIENDIPTGLETLHLQSNLINHFEIKNHKIHLLQLNLMLVKNGRYLNVFKFPTKLRHLQLSIQVDKLSDNFELPTNLQSLQIHHPYYGKIVTFRNFFQNLSNLQLTKLSLLNLTFTKDCLIQIPSTIERLTIAGNFSQNIINNLNLQNCNNLTSLSLSGGSVNYFNLNNIPSGKLEQLELKNMKLKYINGNFDEFIQLEYLNLEQNQITNDNNTATATTTSDGKTKTKNKLNLPSSINTLILNKNDLNDLSNVFLDNCRYLRKIYLEMNPNLDSRVIFKIAKLLMQILDSFVGIYLSLNLIFSSNLFLENYEVYSKIIFNTDFIEG